MNPDSYVPESSDSALNRLPVSEKARGSGIRPGSQAAVLNIPEPRQPLETSGVSGLQNVNHLGENRLRGKLVDRLTLMALRHCRHRAELSGTRRAIGRHALGFFYADTDASGDAAVVAATRAFFDDVETQNLPWILDTLADRAREYPPGLLNVPVHLCNRVEEMSQEATLLGVGVTSVSEPPPTAEDSGYTALGMNRPYRGVAQMVDGTVLMLRCDGGFLAPVDVRSTHSLNVGGQRIRQWEWMPSEYVHGEVGTSDVPNIVRRLEALLGLAVGKLPPLPQLERTPNALTDTGHRRAGRRRRVTGIRLGGVGRQ